MLLYSEKKKYVHKEYRYFGHNAGIPLPIEYEVPLSTLTRAYAFYRLGKYTDAINIIKRFIKAFDDETTKYLNCVNKYLKMKVDGISDDKIKIILYKFFKAEYPDKLYEKLNSGLSPYDDYLMKCNLKNCNTCRFNKHCGYDYLKDITAKLGERYKAFTNGNDRSEFSI